MKSNGQNYKCPSGIAGQLEGVTSTVFLWESNRGRHHNSEHAGSWTTEICKTITESNGTAKSKKARGARISPAEEGRAKSLQFRVLTVSINNKSCARQLKVVWEM